MGPLAGQHSGNGVGKKTIFLSHHCVSKVMANRTLLGGSEPGTYCTLKKLGEVSVACYDQFATYFANQNQI